MELKDDSVQCSFHHILTEFLFGLDIEYKRRYKIQLRLTCGSEPEVRHGYASLHYATPCQAVDIGFLVTDIPAPTVQHKFVREIADLYCMSLNVPANWFDIVLESNHIHIEYQPKRTF